MALFMFSTSKKSGHNFLNATPQAREVTSHSAERLSLKGGTTMFLLLSIVLLLLWLVGFAVFPHAGAFIYLLLFFSLCFLVLHLSTGRRN